MDPFTAISLAGNVLQFISTGKSIIETMLELGRMGTTNEVQQLESRSRALQLVVDELKHSVSQDGMPEDVQRPQKILLDNTSKCLNLVQELQTYTDRLKLADKKKRLKALILATKTLWNSEKLQSLSRELEACSTQMTLQLLVYLTAQQRHNATALTSQIENQGKTIVEAIYLNNDKVGPDTFSSDSLARNYERTAAPSCLLTWEDGSVSVLQQDWATLSTRILPFGDSSVIRAKDMNDGAKTKDVNGNADRLNKSIKSVYSSILQHLHFRVIRSREQDIKPAHAETFHWIFNKSTVQESQPMRFLPWVENEVGFFWIEGKAGSGKSTLMKYISGHPEFTKALQSWTQGSRLVVASYFSWNLGSSLQNSVMGLLRSLLYDILSEFYELIPVILPEYFMAGWEENREERTFSTQPNILWLQQAFQRLASQKTVDLKCCILVDGIDEFEGNHASICDMFSSLCSPNFKVIVSSRPIPACVVAFERGAKLRLQDLTRNDMGAYAEALLSTHPRFEQLGRTDSLDGVGLINRIASKAEGVFLWTTLATASIRDGLDNFDSIYELTSRLEELPQDLKDLYGHMLSKMPPRYRNESIEILRTILSQIETFPGRPLTSLDLSLWRESQAIRACAAPTWTLSDADIVSRHHEIEGRIRSRCWGLVEVRTESDYVQAADVLESRTQFHHRTVAEFLRTTGSQERLWEDTVSGNFNAQLAPLQAVSCRIRISFSSKPLAFNLFQKAEAIHACFSYCMNLSTDNPCQEWHTVLDEISLYLQQDRAVRPSLWRLYMQILDQRMDKEHLYCHGTILDGWSFVLLAACHYSLFSYVDYLCAEIKSRRVTTDMNEVLAAFLKFCLPLETVAVDSSVIRRLLAAGAKLDVPIGQQNMTVGTYFYSWCADGLYAYSGREDQAVIGVFSEIATACVSGGGMKNTTVTLPGTTDALTLSSLVVSTSAYFEHNRLVIREFFALPTFPENSQFQREKKKGRSIAAFTEFLASSRASSRQEAAHPLRQVQSISMPNLPLRPSEPELRRLKWDYVPYAFGPRSDAMEEPTSKSYGPANAL